MENSQLTRGPGISIITTYPETQFVKIATYPGVRTGRLDRLNTLASQIVIVIELLIVELNSKDLSPKDDRVLPFVPR